MSGKYKILFYINPFSGTDYRKFRVYAHRYISVLVELTRMEGTKHGPLVATQLLDVTIRVQAIRKYAVQQCALLLENSYLLTGQPRATMSEVLYAAAWICGEFSR